MLGSVASSDWTACRRLAQVLVQRITRWWATTRRTSRVWVHGLALLWWLLWLVYGYVTIVEWSGAGI